MDKEKLLASFESGDFMSVEVIMQVVSLMDEYYDKFYAPQFIARETGVSRRDLSVWNREGLLLNRNDAEEDGWRKYNMVECFWLNIISKLKKFGLGNDQIIEYKEMLFDESADSFTENIKEIDYESDFSGEYKNEIKSYIEELNRVEDTSIEDVLKRFGGPFGIQLMFTTIFHLNHSLVILENGDIVVINVGKPFNQTNQKNVTNFFAQISHQSFISINLQQITSNFFQNEKLHKDSEFFFGILNHGEQKLITEIRSKKLKQVTVKIKDGSITHIRLTKNEKQNEQLIKQLSRLLKKGDYKRIEITAVDGKISHFDEEDIIKM